MIRISTSKRSVQKRSFHLGIQARENISGWSFLILNFIGYLIFKLVPLIMAMVLSFSKWNFVTGLKGIKFIGLENYIKLFTDDIFHVSMINTLKYSFVMVPISIFLALVVGSILNNKVYFHNTLRLAFYLPHISSMVAVAIIWMILFLPSYGPINTFLQSLGIQNPPRWLNASSTSLLSIMIVGLWQSLGYNVIIVIAGLQTIPTTLYESAKIDGANAIQTFFRITIPSLSSTLFFLTMISFIHSFQVFTPVQVMTEGGPGSSSSVIVYYIYTTAFQYNNVGYASAMSWVLFLMVFIFTAARMIVTRRNEKKHG